MTIHLEMLAQPRPEVGTAEAIRTQRLERAAARNVWANLVAVCLDIIGGRNNWAGRFFQLAGDIRHPRRSEEHTSELQSLMRISYAVFCLKKKNTHRYKHTTKYNTHIKKPTIIHTI